MKYSYLVAVLIGGAVAYRVAESPEWQDSIGDTATAIVRPIVIPLVDLIGKPSFVYVAATVIVLAAIVACFTYWRRVVRPKLRRMRALRFEVASLSPPDIRHPQHRFAAMKELGDLLRREGLFLSAWAAFQGQSARSGRIPEAPFAHFAADDQTTNAAEHRGFMHALPGYFTSVGLILTFLGLVVALYFAAKGFRSGNMDEARAAILQLLNASAFKFLTSVAALGSALMISVFLRFGLSSLQRETALAIAAIEAYISAWRDIEGDQGVVRSPMGEISEKLDVLIGAVLDLNGEIGRLSQRLSAARDVEVAGEV